MRANSLHKIVLLITICAITEAFIYGQQKESFSIRNFTKQEYKAENQNWSITRDKSGLIYVANNVGLLEFDGIDWNFYPAPNGTIIRSVAVDEQDRIFTSGYREIGFWERDLFGNLNYQSLNEKAEHLFSKNEEFWTTVISDEKVYFHSFSSIFIYDYKEFKVVRPDDLISSISNINDNLCLHIDQKGLFMLNDTVLTPFITDNIIAKSLVQFTLTRSDGSLIIGTATEGLILYKENKLSPFLEDWKPYFSKNNINRGAISPNGNIIIGTLLDGIVIFDKEGNLLHQVNNKSGLQNNTVLGINCDHQNNIWLSLDKGLDFISFQINPSYTFYEYDEIGAVYSAVIYESELYIGTNQGVFYRNWNSLDQNFIRIPGTQGQTWDCRIIDNQLLISHNQGSFRIKDHTAEAISPIGGGLNLIQDPLNDKKLIQSTYSYIVFYEKNANNKWQFKYQLPGFSDLIRYIELDHLNNLWASHMHRGVYKLHLNDTHDSILNNQYFGDSIFGKDFDIQVFKIENRIVFTTGTSIYRYNDLDDCIVPFIQLNENLRKYSKSHKIISGPDHHYWFISKEGIALFKIQNNKIEKIKEYPIGLFKDHLIEGFENIYPINAKEGLLCLDNGYAILRADQPDFSNLIQDKQLILKKVEISGSKGVIKKLAVNEKTISISYDRNSLNLSYAFPVFSTDKVEFQSYIDGLDNHWGPALIKPDFSFDRIPPGDYKIKIRAFNKWNNKSITDQINLHVSSPWYLKKTTFLIYLIILIVLLIILRYILVQRIRNREKNIRESKEKELIRLRNEKLNADLSFKSQELANSTMSIIKKNEFLLKLKEIIKHQKEDLGTRYPDKYFLKLVNQIDNNISSMDDWNIFEIHFEKAHEKFLQKLMGRYPQLTHSDLRLCAYLRMNLSSKEIAPLLRISVRGVENHRYKLRKRLNLKYEDNLIDFILSI